MFKRRPCSFAVLGTLLCTGLVLAPSIAAANESEDALFGSGSLVNEVSESGLVSSLQDDLLTAEGVKIGGKYSLSLGSTWGWSNPERMRQNLGNPDIDVLQTNLQASVYLDARPDKDYRVFGKARVSYPFTERVTSPGNAARTFDDIVQVTELFSDFNENEKLFFRAGKQTVSWGVGYFMSPADIVNLTPINPTDPDAEREGPLSLRVNAPVGSNNLYLYVLANDAKSIRDLAIAPKAEVVLSAAELGLGAFYQRDQVPMAMATISSALGDLAVFGEGVLKLGSDKKFVRQSTTGLQLYEEKSKPFLLGTGGLRYSYGDDAGLYNLTLASQYFYNGEGYKNPTVLYAAGMDNSLKTQLNASDSAWPGRHYLATSLAWSDMLKSSLSSNVFWMGNLSDQTGTITGSLAWAPLNRISTSLGVSYSYGPVGREFTRYGNGVAVFLRTSLGSGQF